MIEWNPHYLRENKVAKNRFPTIALYEGQGAQQKCKLPQEVLSDPDVQTYLTKANAELGRNVFSFSQDELKETSNTQLLLFMYMVISTARAIRTGKLAKPPDAIAGLSFGGLVGAYTAGFFGFPTPTYDPFIQVLKLVQLRGKVMQSIAERKDTGLAVLRVKVSEKQDDATAQRKLFKEIYKKFRRGGLKPSIKNANNSIILGGERTHLDKAKEVFAGFAFGNYGINYAELMMNPSAFHTSYVEDPEIKTFEQQLRGMYTEPPVIPIIIGNGKNVIITRNPQIIMQKMIDTLTHPEDWKAVMDYIHKIGMKKLYVVGEAGTLNGYLNKDRYRKPIKIAAGAAAAGAIGWMVYRKNRSQETHKMET